LVALAPSPRFEGPAPLSSATGITADSASGRVGDRLTPFPKVTGITAVRELCAGFLFADTWVSRRRAACLATDFLFDFKPHLCSKYWEVHTMGPARDWFAPVKAKIGWR
jgi:hypothetical protein